MLDEESLFELFVRDEDNEEDNEEEEDSPRSC
jgi:hypothetical protein